MSLLHPPVPDSAIARTKVGAARENNETGHHIRVVIAATAAIVLLAATGVCALGERGRV